MLVFLCTKPELWNLAAAAVAAILLGLVIIEPLYWWTDRRFEDIYGGLTKKKPVPPWLSGIVERAVFAPAFFAVEGEQLIQVATGAFAWLTLKLAANWQMKPDAPSDNAQKHRQQSARSLVFGFLSLSIAAASGLLFKTLCTP